MIKPPLPFYSGDPMGAAPVDAVAINNPPLSSKAVAVIPTAPKAVVVVQKTFVDYLPLILAVISIALTFYILSEQSKKRRT